MACYVIKTKDGGRMFLCGDLGPHCADCADVGIFLCDYPVGVGITCDRPLCTDHATEVAPEVHYCAGHLEMWSEFEKAGGVRQQLENVIPFKAPSPRPLPAAEAPVVNTASHAHPRIDLHALDTNALSAAMRGGTDGWGQVGSAKKHIRYLQEKHKTSRRRCPCGCKTRATHVGMANGVALMSGCKLRVLRWVNEVQER